LWQFHDLVNFLAERLMMSCEELCVAFIIFESCLRARPRILTAQSLRPLLVASCVISCKLLSDRVLTLGWACDQLDDMFTGLSLGLLKALELQVLVVIDWRFPLQGEAYQAYADALFNAATAHAGSYIETPIMIKWPEEEAGATR
jgi:hypothetical protein